ncbi:outer membrane beta-barrel protein [Aquimarina longa]|uniref:outer membrane beta-barrel protein n=1 Tax=Aquimarina longa TaxID=1080221 RepID=UPI0007824FC2|nr:outer membrane beta-barrel protein [Aquimarina longa]
MRKLLLAVFATFSLVAIAQEEDIRFGAKLGVNFVALLGNIKAADARTNFHIGALAEIPISDQFVFQPELLYSAQGAKEKDGGREYKTNSDYVNIPLILKCYVAEGFNI